MAAPGESFAPGVEQVGSGEARSIDVGWCFILQHGIPPLAENLMQRLYPAVRDVVQDKTFGCLANPRVRSVGGDDQGRHPASRTTSLLHRFFVVSGEKPESHLVAEFEEKVGFSFSLQRWRSRAASRGLLQLNDKRANVLVEIMLTFWTHAQASARSP
jgi:hypothetical protein